MADETDKNPVLEKRLKDNFLTFERKRDMTKGVIAGTAIALGSSFGPEIREGYNSLKPGTKEKIVDYGAATGVAAVVGLFAYCLAKIRRDTYNK